MKIVDRIRENYIENVRSSLSKVKQIDPLPYTAEVLKKKKELAEQRKLGVKAWQARTTYELELGKS